MKNRVRTYEDVVENINTQNELLVDARDKKDFYSLNPLNNLTANIPNSLNFQTFIDLYDKNLTRLKDLNQLDLRKNVCDFRNLEKRSALNMMDLFF
jgi:hypothetical protein